MIQQSHVWVYPKDRNQSEDILHSCVHCSNIHNNQECGSNLSVHSWTNGWRRGDIYTMELYSVI